MLSDLSEQEVSDRKACAKLAADPELIGALRRLVKTITDDAIIKFSESDDLDKQWIRGAREAIGRVVPAITERAEEWEAYRAEERDMKSEARSAAVDGAGSGDLALV